MHQNLRVPGPTPLPDDVRQAQAAPMIDHRGSEFAAMLPEISHGIATLIGTSGEVLLLTASGTGALEAAIVNTLSPGDRVLAVSIGSFGDRFAAIAETYGASVERLDVPWGEAADPAALRDHLASHDPYAAVLLTHNETSTGVVNPLRELVAAVREAPGAPLSLVDGISGLGAMPFEMDAWGVDLVASASQKAWMASPGIAIVAMNERAREAGERARMPRFYFDLGQARRWVEKGQTPWTPAVSVLFGLRVGVRRLLAEGRETTWRRHAALSSAVQAGAEALGLQLVAAEGRRSATVTAAWLPDGIEWPAFTGELRRRGLAIAGGQGKLAGKILRIGHMGDVSLDALTDALRVLAETLNEFGIEADADRAVAAAQQRHPESLAAVTTAG
ncbi:MAG TPA: alanine--glyoxylate aminotransferase family protein [Candidatus Limnocylindria bacterium]|nr:alanine--glyoxylate aminotransferase family protein [Candidatus Limnocylindria bacterium]